ncbi:uncharacterized protein VTP21DRAFT_7976 [Calcarisporiella thermophila]|uniref:uncharacterized protein n=1 Tax=Calcarisporiella thermophila TaxID=911321 RepID=UPI003743C7A8
MQQNIIMSGFVKPPPSGKKFATSAQKRSSVLALGSIAHLQAFYARKQLKRDAKTNMLGFQRRKKLTDQQQSDAADAPLQSLAEEPEGFDPDLDRLPSPGPPPLPFVEVDVETDLDVLLAGCHTQIQHMLTTWNMITGLPEQHESGDELAVLPLMESVGKAVDAVKTYTIHRGDLSREAQVKIRRATLTLLEVIKELEVKSRIGACEDEGNENEGEPTGRGEEGEGMHEDERSGGRENGAPEEHGYIYRTYTYSDLARERETIQSYLDVVQNFVFHPPHGNQISSPLSIPSFVGLDLASPPLSPPLTFPEWLDEQCFISDDLGRYRAFLEGNRQNQDSLEPPLPDPHEDKAAFLASLCDGILLCQVYNQVVRKSRRPFGLINKIHTDTTRTYRAIENLRFFAAACKFRFDIAFRKEEFDASAIARQTEQGLEQIEKALARFADTVIEELRNDAKFSYALHTGNSGVFH